MVSRFQRQAAPTVPSHCRGLYRGRSCGDCAHHDLPLAQLLIRSRCEDLMKREDLYEELVNSILAELDYLAAPKAKIRLQELLEAAELADKSAAAVRAELHKHIDAWDREV